MSTDVVVVGAGIIGSSIAYHLARAGSAVTLVERAHPASAPGATWASAGGLRSQGRHGAERPLAINAAMRWPLLAEELDADLETRFGGHLHLAESEAEAPRIRARVEEDRAAGIAVELVGEPEIRRIAPGISASAILGAYTPGDGQAHPGRTARAFVAAAVRFGARLLPGTRTEIIAGGDRATGLRLADGTTIPAQTVVLAAGAWSVGLLRGVGMDLSLRWRGLQMILSEMTVTDLSPTITAVGRNLSLKQAPSGQLMIGGGWLIASDASIAPEPVAERVARQWEGAAGLYPVMRRLAIAQVWAGAEAQSADALPFIGPTPLEGLYVAVGFSNHGFQISPAVGMLVANDILKGPEPMLASFRPDRGLAMSTTEIAAFRDEPVNV
jgi:sarcosine oxidase subunit beta